MQPLTICAALTVLLVITATVLCRTWRARSDQRVQWQGTRTRDWTDDELDALRTTDAIV